MEKTLRLAFPELNVTPDKRGAMVPLIEDFERMAGEPDSPIRAVRRTPARQAVYTDFPESLNHALRTVLSQRNITRLYSHQAEAWRCVESGANPVVVTPTAS